MMMSALKTGGMPLVVDEIREADANNPKGYYEFERVKKMPKGDTAWVAAAPGKAVKIISALLEFLPAEYTYRVIFMERDLGEIMASQQRMMVRNGKDLGYEKDEDQIYQSFTEHLTQMNQWLSERKDFQTLYVSYNDILSDPLTQFRRVADFLDHKVDPAAMTKVVDPQLYREKSN